MSNYLTPRDTKRSLRVRGFNHSSTSTNGNSTLPTHSTSSSRSTSPSPVKPKRTRAASLSYGLANSRPSAPKSLLPRKRSIAGLIVFILFVALILHLLSDLVAMVRYKLRDKAYEEGWVTGCGMRKRPMSFIKGEAKIVLVWETNCDQMFELRWDSMTSDDIEMERTKGVHGTLNRDAEVTRIKVADETDTHWAYQSVLEGLVGGTNYVYEIVTPSEERMGSSTGSSGSKVLERHILPFVGPTPSIPTPTIIHIAAVSDNQFNLRIFHRILLALYKYSKSLPLISSFSPSATVTLPSLIIHVGDKVQNSDNLAQWQTDFWEPMSRLILDRFKRSIPILSARGNHDWDKTGLNAYTGGKLSRDEWIASSKRFKNESNTTGEEELPQIDYEYEGGANARGMFMSYSPHARCRIIVLDSNLDESEEVEQESWLKWELERNEWKDASLRIVVVHVPPFLEYWDRTAWVGGENKWSTYVRTRLTPLLSYHGTSLVLSGHSHAYSRGFLPSYLHSTYSTVANSTTLHKSTRETATNYKYLPQYDYDLEERVVENGTVYTVLGGAGGTLDQDLVEDWGFYEKSENDRHFFGWMTLTFNAPSVEKDRKRETSRVYRLEGRDCKAMKREVLDVIEWKAIDLTGIELDRFRIEVQGCD